ncbi:O-antigen ligase family protein [bacterium]|nr:O-antigen ligase family protein [bacterium]MBT4121822.1 O-antigen ligase family protein [bacterium]MBT4335311.1 O-antigen ligase family protein [bacterium]MBT4495397.1 O-antigen ligase family protein [bacterium]MBT4763622.1 O-antigen ligase family protein [bacterium]
MLNIVLIILFYLLFAYLSSKNVKYGLFMVTALLPSYLVRFNVFNIPTTLLEGMIYILFIIWLFKMKKEYSLTFNPLKWFKSKKELFNPVPNILKLPLILFLVAATISVFVSPNFESALGLWKAYFIDALLYFIIFIYTIKSKIDIQNIIRVLGLTVIVIGLFAIYQKITGNLIPNPFWADESTRRITTFFGYPNANALFISPILLLTLINLVKDKKKYLYQILNILILILGFLTVLWAESTGALLGILAGLITIFIFTKKTRLITLTLIAFVLIVSLFIPGVTSKIESSYISINETHLSASPTDLQLRTSQWRETYELLKTKPILGAGLAGYQTLVEPYHINKHIEIYLYPHNFFLNFYVEIGLLGLISICWLLIIYYKLSYKSEYSIYSIILSSVMITILVHGLVDVPYLKNDLAILFWIIFGLTISIYNTRRGAGVVERAALEKQ